MNDKIKEYRSFDEILRIKLQSPTFAIGYLNEALASKDKEEILSALHDILEARGSASDLSEESTLLNSLADLFVDIGITEFKAA